MPTEPISSPSELLASKDWRYVMAHAGQITFSDEATDLVAALIPDYWHLPQTDDGHTAALAARYDAAVSCAGLVQTSMVSGPLDFDPASISEDELNALLGDRSEPFTGLPQSDGSMSLEWVQAVPLVLVETDYEPVGRLPRPTGQVVFVNPLTELTFLESLDNLGIIELLTKAELTVSGSA